MGEKNRWRPRQDGRMQCYLRITVYPNHSIGEAVGAAIDLVLPDAPEEFLFDHATIDQEAPRDRGDGRRHYSSRIEIKVVVRETDPREAPRSGS